MGRIGRKFAQDVYPERRNGGAGQSCILQIGYDAPVPSEGELDLTNASNVPRTALAPMQIALTGVALGNTLEVDYVVFAKNTDVDPHNLEIQIVFIAPVGYFIDGGQASQTIVTAGEVACLRGFTSFTTILAGNYTFQLRVTTDAGAGEFVVNSAGFGGSTFFKVQEIGAACVVQDSPVVMAQNPG